MGICFSYSLKYSELSNWVLFWMICDNYLLVRSVYNYVTYVLRAVSTESFHFYVFKCIKISFYCFWVLCLIRRVFSHSETTYTKKKSSIVFSFMHLLFGIQVFNSSGIYFGGRLREGWFTLFFLQCCLSLYKHELLHQWSEIPAFSYPKFHDRSWVYFWAFPAVLLTSLLKT